MVRTRHQNRAIPTTDGWSPYRLSARVLRQKVGLGHDQPASRGRGSCLQSRFRKVLGGYEAPGKQATPRVGYRKRTTLLIFVAFDVTFLEDDVTGQRYEERRGPRWRSSTSLGRRGPRCPAGRAPPSPSTANSPPVPAGLQERGEPQAERRGCRRPARCREAAPRRCCDKPTSPRSPSHGGLIAASASSSTETLGSCEVELAARENRRSNIDRRAGGPWR